MWPFIFCCFYFEVRILQFHVMGGTAVLPYSVFLVDFDQQELVEVGTVKHTNFLPSFCPLLRSFSICDDRNSNPNQSE